ncbi:DUF6379 domain-containing protein [Paenarthrobacter sp. NPDC089989]|uniref:C-glycoside deglycosidase beta subunit domain-containing protein n=1 Tax=unclassified Paenarthrobacter TaxID=2634190 RepID=UPI003805CD8B
MLQNALREDALSEMGGSYELRVGLPWIRSMPLSSIGSLAVEVDGQAAGEELRVRLGAREVRPENLATERGWWFIQDRLVLVFPAGRLAGDRGRHRVAVDFQLMVPYLQGGPEGPLVLPFHLEAALRTTRPALAGVARDVA